MPLTNKAIQSGLTNLLQEIKSYTAQPFSLTTSTRISDAEIKVIQFNEELMRLSQDCTKDKNRNTERAAISQLITTLEQSIADAKHATKIQLDHVIEANQRAAETKNTSRLARHNPTISSIFENEAYVMSDSMPTQIESQMLEQLINSQMQRFDQEKLALAIKMQGVLHIKARVDGDTQILSILLTEWKNNPTKVASNLLKVWSSNQSVHIKSCQVDASLSSEKNQDISIKDEIITVDENDLPELENIEDIENIAQFLSDLHDKKQLDDVMTYFLPVTIMLIALHEMINQFSRKFNLRAAVSRANTPIDPTIHSGHLEELSNRLMLRTAQGDELKLALVDAVQAINTSNMNPETRREAEENLTFIKQQIQRITHGTVNDVVAVYQDENGRKQVLFVNLAEFLKDKQSVQDQHSLYQAIYQASHASNMMTFRYLTPIEAQLFQRVALNDATGDRIFNALTRYEPETGIRVEGDRFIRFAKSAQDAAEDFKIKLDELAKLAKTPAESEAIYESYRLVATLENKLQRFVKHGGHMNDIMGALSDINTRLDTLNTALNPIFIEEPQVETTRTCLSQLYSALESLRNALYHVVQMAYDYVYKPVSDVIRARFFGGADNTRQVRSDTDLDSGLDDPAPPAR